MVKVNKGKRTTWRRSVRVSCAVNPSGPEHRLAKLTAWIGLWTIRFWTQALIHILPTGLQRLFALYLCLLSSAARVCCGSPLCWHSTSHLSRARTRRVVILSRAEIALIARDVRFFLAAKVRSQDVVDEEVCNAVRELQVPWSLQKGSYGTVGLIRRSSLLRVSCALLILIHAETHFPLSVLNPLSLSRTRAVAPHSTGDSVHFVHFRKISKLSKKICQWALATRKSLCAPWTQRKNIVTPSNHGMFSV